MSTSLLQQDHVLAITTKSTSSWPPIWFLPTFFFPLSSPLPPPPLAYHAPLEHVANNPQNAQKGSIFIASATVGVGCMATFQQPTLMEQEGGPIYLTEKFVFMLYLALIQLRIMEKLGLHATDMLHLMFALLQLESHTNQCIPGVFNLFPSNILSSSATWFIPWVLFIT